MHLLSWADFFVSAAYLSRIQHSCINLSAHLKRINKNPAAMRDIKNFIADDLKETPSLSSPVFEAMIDGRFKEGKQEMIRLPDDSPDAFAVFVHWLYTRQLPEKSEDGSQEAEDSLQELYLRAFVLGDKYNLSAFKQLNYGRIVDAFEDYFWPSVESMEELYSYQAVTSEIQDLTVDYFAPAFSEYELNQKNTLNGFKRSLDRFLHLVRLWRLPWLRVASRQEAKKELL
ncbi:hypothetical protein VTN77DRAFT_3266 [Rasamsonia byssochlamydoides]|uniref:uncharacterized protein n=1 Tax=Rasamsonia byssochlamydoides TaxID=89139 RepID=UPI003742AA8E